MIEKLSREPGTRALNNSWGGNRKIIVQSNCESPLPQVSQIASAIVLHFSGNEGLEMLYFLNINIQMVKRKSFGGLS